ncbi:hypothetical protein NC01_07420 [Streptococcus uberis]|nr:hypothetical protein NC01_07420 [Streptococcus uberis]
MMKLKLFPKIFMSTLLLFICLIAIVHMGIFYLMPRIYSDMKEVESVKKIDYLADRLDNQSKETMIKILETYAQKHMVNVTLEMDKREYYFGNTTVIDIGSSEEANSGLKIALPQSAQQSEYVISKLRRIKNDKSQTVILQLMMDVTSIKEARQATIRSLPYTLVFSIICSLIFSYIYTRLTVRPIRKMVAVTNEMTHLNRFERYPVKGSDEFNILGRHINELYESLLANIDSLAEENEHIIQLEEDRITFLRAASHELKTPLTSLRLVIENMMFNVGPYKDRDKYLNASLLEIDKMYRMIQNILISQDSINESQYLQEENLSLASLLKDCLEEYRILASNKQLQIDCQLEEHYQIGNRSLLEKIFSNLLSNADFLHPLVERFSFP